MPDTLSIVPEFEILGVTFRCWITEKGNAYQWRSTCGRFFANRCPEKPNMFVAFVDRNQTDRPYPSLKDAMLNAVQDGRLI